jgi:hypothetical protein
MVLGGEARRRGEHRVTPGLVDLLRLAGPATILLADAPHVHSPLTRHRRSDMDRYDVVVVGGGAAG